MDESLLSIVRKYGEKILLKESDMKPKISRKKGKKRSSVVMVNKEKRESSDEWEGPPPWDFTVGGDGCPKFLCDVMVSADNSLCVFWPLIRIFGSWTLITWRIEATDYQGCGYFFSGPGLNKELMIYHS